MRGCISVRSPRAAGQPSTAIILISLPRPILIEPAVRFIVERRTYIFVSSSTNRGVVLLRQKAHVVDPFTRSRFCNQLRSRSLGADLDDIDNV